MSVDLQIDALDRVLDSFTQCLTPEVAKNIVALKADPQLQARIDALAGKCNDGTLTDDERKEYAAYVDAFHMVGILQAKARRFIGSPRESGS